jgi:hypothetical protein
MSNTQRLRHGRVANARCGKGCRFSVFGEPGRSWNEACYILAPRRRAGPMPFVITSLQTGSVEIGLEGDLDVATMGILRAELVAVARRQPVRVLLGLADLRSVPRNIDGLVGVLGDLARTGCRISVTRAPDRPFARLNAALVEAIRDAA